MCMHVWGCVCTDKHMEIRGQRVGVSSLFLPWGFQVSNKLRLSGWCKPSLSTEPPRCSSFIHLCACSVGPPHHTFQICHIILVLSNTSHLFLITNLNLGVIWLQSFIMTVLVRLSVLSIYFSLSCTLHNPEDYPESWTQEHVVLMLKGLPL